MRSKILVTGSGGLLGYALKELLPEAVFVTSRDFDLVDICNVKRLFDEAKPAHVIHLAAKVGGVKKNASSNADLFTANIQINTNVLNVAQEHQVSRLISVLSSCAFPTYIEHPSTESDLHADMPFKGNLGYGYSKRMLDIQTKLLWEQYGSHFSTITPATMYGPNDNWDLESGHVVGSLVHKCYLAKQRSKPFTVWGSGNAVRQFVYSYDIAQLIIQALGVFNGPETLIVTPDSGNTIKDLVSVIAEAMDFTGEIIFDQMKPEGQLVRRLESRSFKDQFPNFHFTSLKQGLALTAAWFHENNYVALEKVK